MCKHDDCPLAYYIYIYTHIIHIAFTFMGCAQLCIMYVWMDGWMAGWLAGWMDGCMYVCMHACMHACMYACIYTHIMCIHNLWPDCHPEQNMLDHPIFDLSPST